MKFHSSDAPYQLSYFDFMSSNFSPAGMTQNYICIIQTINMKQNYKGIILPILAVILTLTAFSYSACQESKLPTKSFSSISELKGLISNFERKIVDLKSFQNENLMKHGREMGCEKDSKALEKIQNQNALIEHLFCRLQYHKLQISQGDTTNADRNYSQILELQKDILELDLDGMQIRNGLDGYDIVHITK